MLSLILHAPHHLQERPAPAFEITVSEPVKQGEGVGVSCCHQQKVPFSFWSALITKGACLLLV